MSEIVAEMKVKEAAGELPYPKVGLGRIVALYYRSSASYQIH
jgi:hypothetical protein